MNIQNVHYHDDRAFMTAVAGALAHEYRATVEAGFTLQVDCPDLFLARNVALPGSPYDNPRYRTSEQYLAHVDLSVAATRLGAVHGERQTRARWLEHITWRPLGLSADCGLSTYAGYPHLSASVAWSKLRRLAETGRTPARDQGRPPRAASQEK